MKYAKEYEICIANGETDFISYCFGNISFFDILKLKIRTRLYTFRNPVNKMEEKTNKKHIISKALLLAIICLAVGLAAGMVGSFFRRQYPLPPI
jgi:hypothetical protein